MNDRAFRADGTFLGRHMAGLAEAARGSADGLEEAVGRYAEWVCETLEGGGRVLLCGNGGSAATVEHVAAEYAVRFRRRRRALPALALATGGAALTAAANDLGFEEAFARAVEAHGRAGDLLVLHSTSGRSPNLMRAAAAASGAGLRTVALLADHGGDLAGAVDLAIRVPSSEGTHVQELHLAIEHAVVDQLDAWFCADGAEAGESGAGDSGAGTC